MTAGLLRRWGPWALLVVSVTLLSILLTGQRSGTPLDPANPGRQGTQALVRVLADRGVDVRVVRSTSSLTTDAAGATVLLSGTSYLGPASGSALLSSVRDADRVVVLVPSPTQDPGEVLGLDVGTTWSSGAPLVPDCRSPFTREGDALTRWDTSLDAGPGRGEVVACYPPSSGHNAGGARAGALLTLPATTDRPEVVLVGFPSALTNEHITEDAHAALGVRLLGQSPTLLWVIPQPGDAGAEGAASLWDVLPRSMTPAMLLLLGALTALALWQGRRLGPVVSEPMPAVVHASQTTRSRGRLYRQAGDRDHALQALRAGTRHRLAPRLGLPRTVPDDELARAVADATGRPLDEVTALLVHPAPLPSPAAGADRRTTGARATGTRATHIPRATDSDEHLVATARELRSLEEGLHP